MAIFSLNGLGDVPGDLTTDSSGFSPDLVAAMNAQALAQASTPATPTTGASVASVPVDANGFSADLPAHIHGIWPGLGGLGDGNAPNLSVDAAPLSDCAPTCAGGNTPGALGIDTSAASASGGFDLASILAPLAKAGATIATARYANPSIPAGSYLQRDANGNLIAVHQPAGTPINFAANSANSMTSYFSKLFAGAGAGGGTSSSMLPILIIGVVLFVASRKK